MAADISLISKKGLHNQRTLTLIEFPSSHEFSHQLIACPPTKLLPDYIHYMTLKRRIPGATFELI